MTVGSCCSWRGFVPAWMVITVKLQRVNEQGHGKGEGDLLLTGLRTATAWRRGTSLIPCLPMSPKPSLSARGPQPGSPQPKHNGHHHLMVSLQNTRPQEVRKKPQTHRIPAAKQPFPAFSSCPGPGSTWAIRCQEATSSVRLRGGTETEDTI